MQELFLYDRDAGLFKEILKLSTVIAGRYFVVTHSSEINTSNFSQYISDALEGMTTLDQKYPCCICMPPKSYADREIGVETLVFNLFFLTRDGHTGTNELLAIDPDAQVSTHHPWQDWQDMKEAAIQFTQVLASVIREKNLKQHISLSSDSIDISRLSNIGTDGLNGARISFRMLIHTDCTQSDYPADVSSQVVIPTFNIHPHHEI